MTDSRELLLPNNPFEALSLLKQYRQDINNERLLNTLTNIIADPAYWEPLRDEGIVDLFTELTLSRVTHKRDENLLPAWVLPLQASFNAMVGMKQSSGGFGDIKNRQVLSKYLLSCPDICSILYTDAQHIRQTQEYAEHIRSTLILWIQAVWNGTAMMGLGQTKNRLKESRIISLSTWCWLHTTAPTLRSSATSCLLDILEHPITSKVDLDEVVAACGSSGRLAQAINHILSDESVLGEPLVYVMALAIALTGQTIQPELIKTFCSANTTKNTMAALRRQLRFAGEEDETDDVTWRLIDYAGMLIVNVTNDSESPTEEMTILISKYSLIPLLSNLLIRFSRGSKSGETWLSLLTLLKHTCTCTSKSCRIRTSPEYLSALRTHLTWRWWPTMKKLYIASKPEGASKLYTEWSSLGQVAGLRKEDEMQRHDKKGIDIQGCWFVECPSLVDPCDPAANPNLRKCSACKKASYCCSDCQSRDWKEHKSKCTAWKKTVQ